MYRNIVYNNRTRDITLWTWDENGDRVERRVPFKPYIHFEQKNGKDGTSIFKTPLRKREFETEFDRRKFVQNSGIKRIFNNLPAEQQFLIDTYGDIHDQIDFTENPLRIFYLDIEVFSPDEFPKAEDAKHPINLITIFDSLTDQYHSFGLHNYISQRKDVTYHKCATESDLLRGFMKYWTKNYPDVMTGWNSDGFDIPYIVNRITQLFGDEYVKRLSPTNRIWSIEKLDRFNNPITEWNIQGVSCIDYLKAYRKFSRNERESYTLDYIGEHEGVGGKIAIDGSLAQLSIKDWHKFVDYNIRDVEVVKKLEDKLHFMELCRMIAYKGLTKFEKALATTNVVGGAFAMEARKMGMIIPTFQYDRAGNPPGGLVRLPEAGFKDAVVSFDAASLYPNTMISLNLSPETKLGQCHTDENFTFVRTVRGKEFKLRNDEFKKWMVSNNVCRSMHGTLFSQNVKGIIPRIIEGIYSDRKTTKARGKKLERKMKRIKKGEPERLKLAKQVEELDVLQYTLKILMNSMYGTFGNCHSVLYDLDLSGSITLTGQEVNLQSGIAVQNYAKDKHGLDDNLIIYGDTDSVYITLTPLFDKLGIKLLKSEERIEGKPLEITEEAMNVIREIGGEDDAKTGAITMHLSKWALEEMNSIDPRFEFNREKISKRGIFLNNKKRYALQVVDNEGFPVAVGDKKEFSYTGIEGIVTSTHAKEIQNINKSIVRTMILEKDYTISNESVKESFSDFKDLSAEVLASRISVKDLKKYESKAEGFTVAKGTPQNSKASLLYNNLLDHLNLGKKYEKITSGNKIKIIYLGKNRFGIDYVGFKDVLPEEFGLEVDYKKLYMRQVYPVVERVFQAVGWVPLDPTKNYSCDILSEFS